MKHPVYTCRHISREIALTGKIDDPLWNEAEIAILTDPITGDPASASGTGRLLYSNNALYLAFFSPDDYIYATFTEPDSPVWTEGCCEFFVCPSGKFRQYYEINVNSLNTVFSTFILNGRTPGDPTWNINSFIDAYNCKDLLTRVHVNGKINVLGGADGWSVEYRIPFTSILGANNIVPQSGDEWLMNLCRIASKKPEEADMRHYSWSTIGAVDFHAPWTFGTLRFA